MKSLTRGANALLVVGVCAVMAAPASAATIAMLLEDDNSEMMIDPASGMVGWTVEGIEQLSRQWFWYRIGEDPEVPITLLDVDAGVTGATDTNGDGLDDVAYVLYHASDFDVKVKVSLDGGPDGTYLSDVQEQVTVSNTSCKTLDFHFYQFADFDLSGTADGDTVLHLGHGAQGQYVFDLE